MRSTRRPEPGRPVRLFVCIGLVALAYLSRLVLLRRYAVNVPFWDQWDAEVAGLYAKLLDGKLTAAALFDPANEHRIFFTRLLHVMMFYVDGKQMNTVHAMAAQAAVQMGTLGVFLWALNRRRLYAAASVVVTGLLALPVSHENLYWSYQSQVYFAIFFAMAAAYFAARRPMALGRAALCALAGGVTMASGTFTALMVAGACGVRAWRTRRVRDAAAAMAFGVLAFALSRLIWHNPGHDVLRAGDLTAFGHALGRYATWPRVPTTWLGLVPWGVGATYAWRFVVLRRPLAFVQRFGLLVFSWVAMVCAAAAYARAGGIANRYFDYTVLPYVAAVLLLTPDLAAAGRAWWRTALWHATLALPVLCVTLPADREAKHYRQQRRIFADQVQRALIAGVQGPDAAYAHLAEPAGLGYPDGRRLAELIADPRTRFMLRALAAQADAGAERPADGR